MIIVGAGGELVYPEERAGHGGSGRSCDLVVPAVVVVVELYF